MAPKAPKKPPAGGPTTSSATRPETPKNDLGGSVLAGSAKDGPAVNLTWQGEVITVNSASPRCAGVAALQEGGQLIAAGGWQGSVVDPTRHAPVQRLDFAAGAWSDVEPTGQPHPGVSQATAVDVGGALLFFGGWTGATRTNATTLYDIESCHWRPFETIGTDRPPATTYHTMSKVGRRVYVFGGNTTEGGQASEMHVLDTQEVTWSTAPSTGAPTKRSSHSATVVNESQIVVFGGRSETAVLGDTAVFDTTSSHWVLTAKAEGQMAPPPRYGHAAAAVGGLNVVVFGGMGDQGQLLNDVWLLRVEKPTMMMWIRVQVEGPPPSVRMNHAAVEGQGVVYFVGGLTDDHGSVSRQVCTLDVSSIAPVPTMISANDNGDAGTTSAGASPPPPQQQRSQSHHPHQSRLGLPNGRSASSMRGGGSSAATTSVTPHSDAS